MHILDVKFHGGSIRRFGYPKVQVLVLSALEKEHIVTVVELGNFVQLVQVLLGVELGLFSGMGK